MSTPFDVIALGTEVAKAINTVPELVDKLNASGLYKFLDTYHLEISRADMDHDDLIVWKQRKEDLMDTIIEELRKR